MHGQHLLTCALLVSAVTCWGWGYRAPAGTSTGVSDCRAADLRGAARWRHVGPTLQGTVTITNRSSSACILYSGADAPVTIDLLDTSERPLPVYPPKPDGPHTIAPGGISLGLAPGRSMTVSFRWSNWCARVPATVIIRARLSTPLLPVTARVRGDAPACVNRSEPSIIDDVEVLTF